MLRFYCDFQWRRFGTLLKDWEEIRSRGRNQTKEVSVAAGYLIKFWWITAEIQANVATPFKQENAFHAFEAALVLNFFQLTQSNVCTEPYFIYSPFKSNEELSTTQVTLLQTSSLAQNWNRSDFPGVKAKFTVYYFTWKKWVKVCSRHCSITVHVHVISARLAMTNDVQQSITCMLLIQISD